ncbi:uncharacterized protein MELLADRAFT_75197 [Melampsora larici-populina 98AG31]|uniref:Uncharacterized protein n=1 Tax=Melampsora larici-populina (strain 98AG31 / pathotype 3-4-7) TaxID=747676 RepID=F4RTB2_MELLP|nr:uncharacterized protein MELLADRAFT_75197 [Melampsora larici-populina 98AG31]EGG04375.1 hypothetical protein MELLADRAFT_75197 [Melampsora larici-populina 98AG31]
MKDITDSPSSSSPITRVSRPEISLKTRLCPRPSTIAIAVLSYWFNQRNKSLQKSKLVIRLCKWIAILIAILNWRAVPFYWHVATLFPILKVKCRRWRLGSDNEAFVRSQGVIGMNPFEVRTVTKHCATWNACDFMMHMSNSSYAAALDEARCDWHVNKLGILMRNDMEYIKVIVASTHLAFLVEIPMLADYEVEVRPVSWDNKWVYLLSKFTTAPPKGSTTRTLNCISITRTVHKIGRRTVPPAKVYAAGGFGPDESNWHRICKLRQERKPMRQKLSASQEWLLNGEPFDGMDRFEEQRQRNLEIIRFALDGNLGVEALKDL